MARCQLPGPVSRLSRRAPECNAIPATEVPIEIIHATYEAALRELASPGSLSPDFVAT